jgi:hypothetical protein
MAKKKPAIWDKARAMYEANISYREIGKALNIPFNTVYNRAKKEEWNRTLLEHVIVETVQSKIDFCSLNMEHIVSTEVDKRLKGFDFYQSQARKVVKLGIEALKQSPTEQGMKTVLDGMKSGMQVEGLVPFYPNSTINNVNAQQNVTEEKVLTLDDMYNGNT